jgi:DNA-binding XRE family transcriptional regulator
VRRSVESAGPTVDRRLAVEGGLVAKHNRAMPNIASVLKSEMARVARKEVRSEIESLKKAAITYRADIAALKRRTHALEQGLRRLAKAKPAAKPLPADDASATSLRFSAKGLASHRARLGLSAEDCGRLLGVSGQSIYQWEAGKVRPRARHLPAIAAFMALGKKEAAAALASLPPVRSGRPVSPA